tara:strand:+ start:869 stop:1420 length:552 start_codon:yes stop_codon:yes gene_type:complete
MTTKLKSIKIKGKEYVEVNERLKFFRATYPNYSLVSEVIDKTESSILIMASVIDENDNVLATGLAEEEKGSTFINKTSYVENCETSAWGRALANFGIGLDTAVASAEEVKNAIANQNTETKFTVKDVDIVAFMKWVSALPKEQKTMKFIVAFLKDNNYNITEEVKTKISNKLKNGNSTKTKKR